MLAGRSLAVVSALMFIFSTAFAHAESCSLKGLAWMAGNWRSTSDPLRSQERWVLAPDDVIMGSAWELPAGKAGYAEVMTVRPDGNVVSMYLRHFDGALNGAREERDAPMKFTATACTAASAIFDGQGDHAGEQLAYTRSGSSLTIIGNFLHQGKPVRMEWRMTRSAG